MRTIVAIVLLVTGSMSGCGLGETAATTAAGGMSKAEEARRARETQARVQEDLEAAQQAAAEQRATIDEAAQ
jgi:hypothetical protein